MTSKKTISVSDVSSKQPEPEIDLAPGELERALATRNKTPVPNPTPMPARQRRGAGTLTLKESQVLALVFAGKRDREIATQLGIARPTVRQRLARAFDVLQVRTRTAAARAWRRHNPT